MSDEEVGKGPTFHVTVLGHDPDWIDPQRAADFAAIVRELAERGPFYGEARMGGWSCHHCLLGLDDGQDQAIFNDPANHEPSCLWRRARALYPKAAGS